MRFLRQSTAASISFGPFVAVADGVTPVSGGALTVQSGRIIKNGVASAFAPSSWVADATTGYYIVGLGTGDIDTLGRLTVHFDNPTTYCPVWEHFSVISPTVFDVIFGTSTLPVNVTQVNGATASIDTTTNTQLADIILGRSVSTALGGIEGSMPEHCLGTIVLAMLEWSISNNQWTINQSDGVTPLRTKVLTSQPGLNSITSVQ